MKQLHTIVFCFCMAGTVLIASSVLSEEHEKKVLELSTEEVASYLKQGFLDLDRNGDGFIDSNEAPRSKLSRTNSLTTSSVSLKVSLTWIEKRDLSKDGKISFSEYKVYFQKEKSSNDANHSVVK